MSDGASLFGKTWQACFSWYLLGSQTTELEEGAYGLPASSDGPDHQCWQSLYVKLLTWWPVEFQGVRFCSEKTALIGNSS